MPARMLSYGGDGKAANFMLGQENDEVVVRLRTNGPGTNEGGKVQSGGEPIQVDKQIRFTPAHYVVTYDIEQVLRLYVDGTRIRETRLDVPGPMTAPRRNWAPDFSLNVANEGSNDRPWLATAYFLAVYNSALDATEMQEYYATGVAQ